MKSNRRNFLKFSGLTGIALAADSIVKGQGEMNDNANRAVISQDKHFNMCGYAAPKLETVRIGFIGLGNRGPGAVNRTSKIEGVDITPV